MADGSSRAAPYLGVAAAFRARIADGTWAHGERLSSRGELGAEFGVGENVIRRAQELLITEGLLEGRAGSGTYVRAPYRRRTMLRTPATGLAGLGADGTYEADSIAKVPAPPDIAERLDLEPGELCVRTTYEIFADRQPAMLSTSWEPMAITGGTVIVLPEGGPLAGRGVAARMAHLGITVDRAVERLRPVHVERDQAQLLGVPSGTQATLIQRTHYSTDGRPVETADLLIPADRWDITYDVPVPPVT
ncbi:GntR family transcriptional regulator [Streptomyces sp. WAC05858]|uniref:GntR family transcriptional regulator n=1 Tax=Streptomyces TaxID=1883 RepID=UPI000F78A00C|nr:GntR family transcriptional regulator [Streptomyces sp. WAC05858]RSS46277.1 GntR family transcriptional regulator [Streptomyces sp. WAC05858]